MTEAVTEVVVMDEENRRELLLSAVFEAIRARSSAGELASDEDLQGALLAAWETLPVAGDQGTDDKAQEAMPALASLLEEMARRVPDFLTTQGVNGETFYYFSSLMSKTYAEIMARKSSPHLLIATEVRRNSKEYPRAIPIDIFEYPPFGLTADQVQEAMKFLAEAPDFADITYTTSSVGTVYLFSTDYMDRNYGEFMAEHADVIRATSP